jgi:acyl-CoA synthetase (AMP-forming)/AMP-acid ligase II
MLVDLQVGDLTEPLTGRSWTRHEVTAQIFQRIGVYVDRGIGQGDRVLFFHGNNLDFFADLIAVWHLGACAIPIDSRLTSFEVENLARTVKPRFALIDSTLNKTSMNALSALNVTLLNTQSLERSISKPSVDSRPLSVGRLDDEALILFTSGSTGSPKGVVHTHRSLRARWAALRECLGVESYRRTLCLLPTHFGHGLICNCLFPWLSGQHLFIAPPFSTDLLMQLGRLIDRHKITFLSSVPSMWALTLKASKPPQAKSLRRIHCGSAPLSAHLWRRIQDWAGIKEVFNAYGITETGSWVAGTTIGEFEPADGLVGVPWGAVIKILKSDGPVALFDHDAQCRVDEVGYVWLSTPALMQGYFAQRELTDQVVCNDWFLTGDMGFIDGRGWFYLKGRERDEINKGGTKIYPIDIEAVVEKFEYAESVCTFAVADPLYGQNVAMAVVLKRQDAAAIQALHRWMKAHLADFKMPQRWYVVDALPQNSRGKVSRQVVQEMCAGLSPLDLPSLLRSST